VIQTKNGRKVISAIIWDAYSQSSFRRPAGEITRLAAFFFAQITLGEWAYEDSCAKQESECKHLGKKFQAREFLAKEPYTPIPNRFVPLTF
jgi:hypothetical protein